MTNIVERLRDEPHRVSTGLVLEAADEIERLRHALQEIALHYSGGEGDENAEAMKDIAKRALKSQEP